MKSINSIRDIINWLSKILIIFTSFLMIALTITVFVNVIVRYFFSSPIAITYEMVELIFPWIIFLAVINVTNDEENIDIKYFVNLLPKPFQIVSAYLTKAVMLFFSFYIIISSFKLTSAVRNSTLPILGISKSWLYISMGVGFIGVSIVIVFQILLMIIDEKKTYKER